MITKSIVGLIALLHFYIMILEMFFWTKPRGLKVFGQSLENARNSARLAANQGLYNGFLSAGLIWGLVEVEPVFAHSIQIFFLSCVFVAGLYGAWSIKPKILLVQSVPAALGLILALLRL